MVRNRGWIGGRGPVLSSAFPGISSSPGSAQSGSKIAFKNEGYCVTAGGGEASCTPSNGGLSPAIIASSFPLPNGSISTVFVISVVPSMKSNEGVMSVAQELLSSPMSAVASTTPTIAASGTSASAGTDGWNSTIPPKL
jgi:hypothetical protein